MAVADLRRVGVKMRPEGGKAVGGAGSPCGEGADAAGSVISAESAPREVFDVKGACWATLVAAAGTSAQPVPPAEGTAKTKAKAVSAAGKLSPRSGRQPSVVTAAVTRPADDAMCEVTQGAKPVSLRRLASDARSRCHSLVWLRRDGDSSLFLP